MRRKRLIQTVLLTVVLAGGAGFALMAKSASKSAVAPIAPPPVPIVAGTVAQHDVPIYLTGVGTVVAYNTDVVRSQIQGQLVSINFTEGQTVHAGDLLGRGRCRLRQCDRTLRRWWRFLGHVAAGDGRNQLHFGQRM